MKKALYFILTLILLLLVTLVFFINTPQFGRSPTGARLEKIMKSPNFVDGHFLAQEPIVNHFDGNVVSAFAKFLFDKKENLRPHRPIEHIVPNFKALDPKQNVIIWLGHSSFYLQIDGKKILVDPVFDGHASPLSFMMTAFDGTDVCSAEDFPELDLILISHDHWDHLEYGTIKALKDRVKNVVVGLGIGEYFEMWGYEPEKIHDLDYGESFKIDEDLTIVVTPARHFSGRFLIANPTEPASFVIKSKDHNIFYSGDGGYGLHFKRIGDQYGPFDFAIMENGQYDHQWPNVHMMPIEMLQAANEIRAQAILPVHNSKFILSNHTWHDPLDQIKANKHIYQGTVVTPLIGQTIDLDHIEKTPDWWENN